MATFLIHNPRDNTYQEMLTLSCIAEGNNRRGKYRFEKKMNFGDMYQTFTIKDTYVLPSLSEVQTVEQFYKRKLREWVEEERSRKKANHRAQTTNYIMKSNGREVFNLKKEFEKLWDATDEQINKTIDSIEIDVKGKGTVYEGSIGNGFLI